MPLSDHQNLMARIAAAVAAAKKANVAEPVDQKPAIAKVPKKRGAKPMNQNAKKDQIRDAVLTVRITKKLKNELVIAAKKHGKRTGGSGKLAPYVEMLLESGIEAEYEE